MDDVRQDLAALRRSLRRRAVAMTAALMIALFALGGADVAAGALLDSIGWRLSTKDGSAADTVRLSVTGDIGTAKVQVHNANFVLTQGQVNEPAVTTEGTLWYESDEKKLRYRNGSSWVAIGSNHVMRRKATTEIHGTTLEDDDELKFVVGAGEIWEADLWVSVTRTTSQGDIFFFDITSPAQSSITYWAIGEPGSDPSSDPGLTIATASATERSFRCSQSGIARGTRIHVSVANGSTAGPVVLRWRTDSEEIQVDAGSSLEATRIQ